MLGPDVRASYARGMTIRALPLGSKPVCADPKLLPLVDRAFGRRPAKHIAELRRRACAACDLVNDCLLLGATAGEFGPWGGVSSRVRTMAGAPAPSSMANMEGVVHPKPPTLAERRGVPDKTIRAWAREQGLDVPPRGKIPQDVRAAYNFEHEDAA